MIEHLYIKNAVLIDEVSIDFNKGLNILSGETGAGKSIIIDSIGFVFGARQGKDFIRRGEASATVEALLYIEKESTRKEIAEMGIEIDEDNSIFLSRCITSGGKNICRINGKSVNVNMLKNIAEIVIDIHSQHEHQALLNQSKHITILDKFCPEELNIHLKELEKKRREFASIRHQLDVYSVDEEDKQYKTELYEFQINEIVSADLREGEEETVRNKIDMLEDTEKIIKLGNTALEFLYRSEEMSASDRISGALSNLFNLYNIDSEAKEIYDELERVSISLDDVIIKLRNYIQEFSSDSSELKLYRERLETISTLKRKYGMTLSAVFDFLEKTRQKYDILINSEEMTAQLEKKRSVINREIISICANITKIRKATAQRIKEQVEKSLHELGMKDAVFEIKIEEKDSFSASGRDVVEFMICANKGDELKPLSKTASGGEMSRVMFSLKSVLAQVETTETFIFDEIDTGVSGRTAHQVAIKLAEMSRKHQIMCITHLPQIASMADGHFLIEKKSDEEKTSTSIIQLEADGIINELSRLTGGAKITDSTLTASKDMKKLADEIKHKLDNENLSV